MSSTIRSLPGGAAVTDGRSTRRGIDRRPMPRAPWRRRANPSVPRPRWSGSGLLRLGQRRLRGVDPEQLERRGAGVPVLVMDALRHPHRLAFDEVGLLALGDQDPGSLENEIDLLGLWMDVIELDSPGSNTVIPAMNSSEPMSGDTSGTPSAAFRARRDRSRSALRPGRARSTDLHSSASCDSRPGTTAPSYSAAVGPIMRIGRSRACSSTKCAASPKLRAMAKKVAICGGRA